MEYQQNISSFFYDYLHCYTDGKILTNLLHNRGRSRSMLSKLLTKVTKDRLQRLKAGAINLPTAGNSDLPPISLTSWPPRYDSLPLVLLNLLDQDLLPSNIFVWIASKDFNLLDAQLINIFEKSIVRFYQTEDFGPHKKWLPLVLQSEEPFVICDDDIFYPKSWYRNLVKSDDERACVGHRCHKLKISSKGEILSYHLWEKDVQIQNQPSHLLTAIGCGGVMIHPHRISSRFRNWELISNLCPMSDDTWLKLAHIDSRTPYKKTDYYFPYIDYKGSQQVSLMQTNVNLGRKDMMLHNSLSNLSLDLSLLM
ncbi:hypothetical protein BJP36_32425 [Moorena producens JHB]|uniref:Glycosyltransferase n=1 Tax=Moorena producens (strain JHB) TaxID=1454205 RepID=A0A1D9G8Q1_MOOP1|nr:hypothetical protein [Moorena producens]AOY83931.2 hypothetical protein BJP36_32425 [Moorena producens JHB]